ncbi:MAG: L,D-transpeptidase, partial [Myxococcales bacterium]|nr:L,D-transpeptidase [Myxococcales bacterium]
MARRARTKRIWALAPLAALLMLGCTGKGEDAPALNKPSDEGEIPSVPVPPANGPKLGAIGEIVPVLERPAQTGRQLGYLHAGALVARAEEPYSKDGCEGGWYPIRPKGFVCAGETATTDLKHPTLVAMSLQPKLDQTLPYTYARARKDTPLYERDPDKDNAVREVGKLRDRSVLAVVGSWSALDPDGKMQRLGLTTSGRFVRAADLEPIKGSDFKGVEIDGKADLPLGFVVKRGIRFWDVEKGDADKLGKVDYHAVLQLTGRFRTVGPMKYWATADNKYVRHRDVTVVRKRNVWPDFATGDQKWIDVSIVTGTMVLYEGRKPLFVTLVSVGRDRLGDPQSSASTAQGVFDVVGKHITAPKVDPKNIADYFDVYDPPWAIELSSGQLLHAALWHNRFGIEHGLGNVQMSPADALRVWSWVDPAVPEGWHGVTQPA